VNNLRKLFKLNLISLFIIIYPAITYADVFFKKSDNDLGTVGIHTWGYGDLILRVLAGVSSVINESGNFYIIFGIFLLVGISLIFFEYIKPTAYNGVDPLKIARWALWITIVYALVFKVQVKVYVEEHSPYVSGTQQAGELIGSHWTVDVPWIIGYPLHVFSNFEYAFGAMIENYFYDDYDIRVGNSGTKKDSDGNIIPDVSYTASGFLSPLLTLNELSSNVNASFDPYLYTNINQYITDCVMPEIITGRITMEDLLASNDLASIMFSYGTSGFINPARVTKFMKKDNFSVFSGARDNKDTISATINKDKKYNYISCGDASDDLNGYIGTNIKNKNETDLLKIFSGFIGGNSNSLKSNTLNNYTSTILDTNYSKFLGIAPQYLLNYQQGASQFFTQSLLMNQFNEAYSNWAAMNGIPQNSISMGMTRALSMTKEKMSFSAVMASKYMPIIKGIIMVIVIGFTPIIILMLLTPMATKFLFGYFSALLWLALWHVGAALLNSIILFKAANYLPGLTGGNYNMMYKYVIDSNVIDYINMAGSMYWSVPMIALMVAGGFSMYLLNTISHAVAEKVDAATSSAAAETSVGNLSYGNISANNLSGNKTNFARAFSMGSTFNNTWATENSYRVHQDYGRNDGTQSIGGMDGYGETVSLGNGRTLIKSFTSSQSFQMQNAVMDGDKLISGSISANNPSAVKQAAAALGDSNGLKHLAKGNEVSNFSGKVQNGEIIEAVAQDAAGNTYESKMTNGVIHTIAYDKNHNQTAEYASGKGVNIAQDIDGDGNKELIKGAIIMQSGNWQGISGGYVESNNSALNGLQISSMNIVNGKVANVNASKIDYAISPNDGSLVEIKTSYVGNQVTQEYLDSTGSHQKIMDLSGNSAKTVLSYSTGQGSVSLGGGYSFQGEMKTIGEGSNAVTYMKGAITDSSGKAYQANAQIANGKVSYMDGTSGHVIENKDINRTITDYSNRLMTGDSVQIYGAPYGQISQQDFAVLGKYVNNLQSQEDIKYASNIIAGEIYKSLPNQIKLAERTGGESVAGVEHSERVETGNQLNAGVNLSGLTKGLANLRGELFKKEVTSDGTNIANRDSSGISKEYMQSPAFQVLQNRIESAITQAKIDTINKGLTGEAAALNQGTIVGGEIIKTVNELSRGEINAFGSGGLSRDGIQSNSPADMLSGLKIDNSSNLFNSGASINTADTITKSTPIDTGFGPSGFQGRGLSNLMNNFKTPNLNNSIIDENSTPSNNVDLISKTENKVKPSGNNNSGSGPRNVN
jgi:hypothetical protein